MDVDGNGSLDVDEIIKGRAILDATTSNNFSLAVYDAIAGVI